MTKKKIEAIRRSLKRVDELKAQVATARDRLRKEFEDLENILETLDDGIESIEDGRRSIQDGLDKISEGL